MLIEHFQETWPRRKMEWFLGAVCLGEGIIFVLSMGLFSRPYYQTLVDVAPQQVWALACMLVGPIGLAFLFINGVLSKYSAPIRCLAACARFVIWMGFTWAAIFNSYISMALAFWPLCLLFDAFIIRETALEWGTVWHLGKRELENAYSG